MKKVILLMLCFLSLFCGCGDGGMSTPPEQTVNIAPQDTLASLPEPTPTPTPTPIPSPTPSPVTKVYDRKLNFNREQVGNISLWSEPIGFPISKNGLRLQDADECESVLSIVENAVCRRMDGSEWMERQKNQPYTDVVRVEFYLKELTYSEDDLYCTIIRDLCGVCIFFEHIYWELDEESSTEITAILDAIVQSHVQAENEEVQRQFEEYIKEHPELQ